MKRARVDIVHGKYTAIFYFR